MSPYVVAVSSSDLRVEQREVPPPATGRVLVAVRAAGMNPYDLQRIGGASEASPVRPGGEVAGVVAAVGDGVDGVAVGDEVVAQPVIGGWAGVVVAKAEHVFARPAPLTFPQAANLLVAGTAAAHAVAAAAIGPGGTVLVHGASGGVGQQVVQLARLRGATSVIGTCGAASDGLVERLGAVPVRYGPGLLDRVRALAPRGVTAAVDCAGTAEAREASMALVDDPAHAVTLADFSGAFAAAGGRVLGSGPGADPGAQLRAAARGELIRLADAGSLQVVVARTFPLDDVDAAVQLLASRRAGGKLALVP